MGDVVDALRQELIAEQLVRRPDVAGAGARPWPPPAWKHPDNAWPGPGDAKDEGRPATTWDDGLVVSLMWAPAIRLPAGSEERREPGVDVVFRGTSVPAILALDAEIRAVLMGDPPDPGGRTDWIMGGLYIVQSKEWKPLQPVRTDPGIFTFSAGYTFEHRA